MIVTREPLFDKQQTSDKIKYLIKRFNGDLKSVYFQGTPVDTLPLDEYFDLVKNIRYRKDRKPIEVISRPIHIFKYRDLGMDCKKKTVLMGSWCEINGKRFRLIGSSQRSDGELHHIFPQVFYNGAWRNIDATYPYNRIFEQKQVTGWEIL